MTAKLNQIVAVEKGTKERTHRHLTETYQRLQKTQTLAGQTRRYEPLHEEGQRLPDEAQHVQLRANDVIKSVSDELTRLIDVTATKDWSNCRAVADVVVDGNVLIKDAPVTFLLFLEKQLVDIHTFVSKLPTLDPSEKWEYDDTSSVYRTPAKVTFRTQKIPRNHVKAEATDKHPAQVEVYYEDVPVGQWTTYQFSGALPADQVRECSRRVQTLQDAVKKAREEANMAEAETQNVGAALLDYIFPSTL